MSTWKFGVEEMDDETFEYRIVEKPFSYRGHGYYSNPKIFDENGRRIVGNDEYYVFEGEQAVRRLMAAPALAAALRPFAALLSEHHEELDDNCKVLQINDAAFTVGDLRRAVAALKSAGVL